MNYAGFRPRFWAGLVDFIIFIPIIILAAWAQGISLELGLATGILTGLLFSLYNIYLHGRYGQTFGKMLNGVKVKHVDGSSIGFNDALYRHSVDLLFGIAGCVAQFIAYTGVSDTVYINSPDWLSRAKLIQDELPPWYETLNILSQVWVWSELIVLLFNKKKRALHDFIAGTVVICVGESKTAG